MEPNPEFDKINHFIAQGKKLKKGSEESVKEIYERWELFNKPQPFILEDGRIELAEKKLKLPCPDIPKTAFYSWDPEHDCASLTIETPELEQKFLLRFKSGKASVTKCDPVEITEETATQGEMLELVFDAIKHIRQKNPSCDIFNISKKDFSSNLEEMKDERNENLINSMKRLPLGKIRELIKNASADMAADELSAQLSLGLDGTYAASQHHEEDDEDILNEPVEIPSQTRWAILRRLDFINSVCDLKAKNEKEFVLDFHSARVVGKPDNRDAPLKLRVPEDAPLNQGDLLQVKIRGENLFCGTFKIDLFDGNSIFGRMRCDFPDTVERYFNCMYATLPKSPSEYLAANIHDLHHNVKLMEDKRLSPGLKYTLGLEAFTFSPKLTPPRTPSVEMDSSQIRAWEAAVNPSNPVALVQGPPGTGKTFVLEQTLRELCRQGLRVLTAAPSNTAIDNICRRISELPVLRFGRNIKSIAPDVAERCWVNNKRAVDRFIAGRKKYSGGIYAGTNVGLLRDQIVQDDMERNGKYDAVVFDEAGMSNIEEFLLCANFGKRVILFGDHQQLPPFPLPHVVIEKLHEKFEAIPRHLSASTGISALEYLAEQRKIPVILLGNSYRCQNPRLLRFASTLFYDACVKTSSNAEYYQLAYHERERRYPASTMRLYSTSNLRDESRRELLCFDGRKPGLANQTEALICSEIFYEAAAKYPLDEITIIAPYRKQVTLLRETLSLSKLRSLKPDLKLTEAQWQNFIFSRIATVDSFQGGESDVVIICYVRSNDDDGIGFIDNPNRINVAHTRCRREMHIVGDMDGLKRQAKSNIFERLERAFKRDGEILKAPGKYNLIQNAPSPERVS
jgi:hypothetical protein